MKTYTIINQKGGVGKTTTAQNLGAYLRLKGYNVLFIDLDNQANLTYSLGVPMDNYSLYDYLNNKVTVKDLIINLDDNNAGKGYLIAGNDNLALMNESYNINSLKELISKINIEVDYIVIDTPPTLSIRTLNALNVADDVIITAQADVFSLQGINALAETINAVKTEINSSLNIAGILITRFNSRTIFSNEITEIIKQITTQLDTAVFNNKIRENIAIKESQANKLDIFSYSPKSNGAIDYKSWIENEIL